MVKGPGQQTHRQAEFRPPPPPEMLGLGALGQLTAQVPSRPGQEQGHHLTADTQPDYQVSAAGVRLPLSLPWGRLCGRAGGLKRCSLQETRRGKG